MKLLVSLGAFLFSGIIAATPLRNIVVFGDSLSDNGNMYKFMNNQLPPSPPYFQGRFSNGPVWVEHVVASYFPNSAESHLANYAYGGSGVSEDATDDDVLFTLRRQVNTYFLEHQDKASEDSLYVVWIGANNYLGLPEDTEKALSEVNSGITHSLELLVSKGAKHILVINIPNLGKTPAATEFDAPALMDYFSVEHNERLRQTFETLKHTYTDTEWLYFDIGSMFEDVVAHPSIYGFTNVNGSCVNAVSNELTKKSLLRMVASATPKENKDACDGYLFFDLVHPTGFAHEKIADQVRNMLDAAGVEFKE